MHVVQSVNTFSEIFYKKMAWTSTPQVGPDITVSQTLPHAPAMLEE
jgi:hypothetical protein